MIWGISHNRAIMLDYDNEKLTQVLSDARRLQRKYQLRGFLVVESSKMHYHVIFDKCMESYRKVCEIIDQSRAWSQKDAALRYMRQDTTLRLSNKVAKDKRGAVRNEPVPRVVVQEGAFSQHGFCKLYLLALEIARKVSQ